jgi:glutamate 5-kinase
MTKKNVESNDRDLGNVRRLVVKLGSHVVTRAGYSLDEELFHWLAEDVAELKARGVDVAIVSSGAVASGLWGLGLTEPPATIPEKQAVAAVGQINLVWRYKEVFEARGLKVGQVLLTHEDLKDRNRFMNAKNTFNALFEKGVVPIINENDTVVVKEIKLGDNDNLSALVANLINADCLVILSDVAGLFSGDPKVNPEARLLTRVDRVEEALGFVGESKTKVGTGGMASKLTAAKKAVHGGIACIIACGKVPHMLRRLMAGEVQGTYFPPMQDRLKSRKHWIAYTLKPSGILFVDDGAARAVLEQGKSLLPKGIASVDGDFKSGKAVSIRTTENVEIARGLTNYSAEEVRAIAGLASWEIVDKLGYKFYDEVVHRDDLVVV